jgi:hypothetical protein
MESDFAAIVTLGVGHHGSATAAVGNRNIE